MPVSLGKKASLSKSFQEIWSKLPLTPDKLSFITPSGKSSILSYLMRQPWFQELSGEEKGKIIKRFYPFLNKPPLEDAPSFEGI